MVGSRLLGDAEFYAIRADLAVRGERYFEPEPVECAWCKGEGFRAKFLVRGLALCIPCVLVDCENRGILERIDSDE